MFGVALLEVVGSVFFDENLNKDRYSALIITDSFLIKKSSSAIAPEHV